MASLVEHTLRIKNRKIDIKIVRYIVHIFLFLAKTDFYLDKESERTCRKIVDGRM